MKQQNSKLVKYPYKRKSVGLPSGGHATFVARPTAEILKALIDMVELAKKNCI